MATSDSNPNKHLAAASSDDNKEKMDKKLQNPREGNEGQLPKLANEEDEETTTAAAAGLVGKEDEMEELGNLLAISSPFTQYPWITEADPPPPTASTAVEKKEAGLRCPRCESTDTKFCYFNNYSLSQPRHFCRACKRSWTRGGALRDVPAGGGGGRKNKGRVIHPSSSE